MRSGSVLVAGIWTEALPKRREKLAASLVAIEGSDRFTLVWIGSKDTEKAGVAERYYRADAAPFAGIPKWRAWLVLRRNAETTLGTSRRAAGPVALAAAAWNIVRGKGLTVDAPPSEQSDDVTRKHLRALELLEESGADWLLGLEDDAIGEPRWTHRIEAIVDELSSRSEGPLFVAVSEGAGLQRTNSDPKPDSLGLFEVKPPTTRTACAYLINREAARRLRERLAGTGVRPGAGMGFDFLSAFALAETKVRAFWTEPAVFLHGSEQKEPGGFDSAIPRVRG